MLDKKKLLLYAVTDRKNDSPESFLKKLESALLGGVRCVQLREKNLSEEKFLALAIEVKKLCEKYSAMLIINDNLTVAIKSGADGIHVGEHDLSPDKIRAVSPKGFIIGVTAKTVEQAKEAEKNGADYIGSGAVFPSPTKPDAISITAQKLCEICSAVLIPVVAIGGINCENIKNLKGLNISGVAVSSSLFGATDIKKTAQLLKLSAEDLVG